MFGAGIAAVPQVVSVCRRNLNKQGMIRYQYKLWSSNCKLTSRDNALKLPKHGSEKLKNASNPAISVCWCWSTTLNEPSTERQTSCKPRGKLSFCQRHLQACSSPCCIYVRQRKCEVMKQVGGMLRSVLGFVKFEWTPLRHLESADLQSNFVSKDLWTVWSFSCEPCSTLCLLQIETSFEPQGVFPQNGNS